MPLSRQSHCMLSLRDIFAARDVYEVATLLSVKQEDDVAFERQVAQAKTFYVDYAGILPASSRQTLIQGLNLMRLVAQNRIAEFHTELELVPAALRSDSFIEYALRLEQYLMEGSYSKIREATMATPDSSFEFFVDMLMITVREEIASCSQRAYAELSTEVACKLLSLSSEAELASFCEERGWIVDNANIRFSDAADHKPSMDQVPSIELIKRSLEYARELEQII